jgi:hypothetical protein
MAEAFATSAAEAGLVADRAELERLTSTPRPLTPAECAERAERAAGALDLSELKRRTGDAFLLWRSETSEAWLNVWRDQRDTGYHDHDGSCVGVYVIDGVARNESLVIAGPRRVRQYTAGDRFSFPGYGIHRMEHEPGGITIHVYSPPIRSIGHYDLEDGELRRQPSPPDEPSPPSPALLAAVASRKGTSPPIF